MFHVIRFGVWLIGQVFAGALTVTRDVVRRHSHMHPIVVAYPLRVTKDWQIAALSTCITMTPGTLSVGLRPDADGDGPEILLVQAVYGAEPAEVFAGLADMEERMVPSVRGIDHGAPGQGAGEENR
ncbi:monovalent cation/H+ antiporter subunit E [Corynebacterium sp. CCM 8835]|uniref:Monovalent cation/H+ antiporter subunit E n=1 Tax=Corynebacterium antarcticum TaxID=2800405 RepID=A0A9Q4CBP5_9CORY|nr:monovalent cation/H+ antiporter subunit E [Corynebacterium antarcticum]MCK7642520.1 monovalent cation/H+ antiporter subunit E [Corynebacterium antarcticum]MCK7660795.1 monovalent cation/H+ antiporter subunit E [Corynebacterium antarcticum]MCL0245542.1 monovalent cation/H+ antiporter subunit E [Corynebacterium antarcticum]MCX7492003.1 monovalent cation/H+ antiporter subunit E [Corynebacterium antarcticum]MCX7537948.1 monovalent cation/H+ antiporter subunit E [Corynebacterium antarcticum]